VLRVCAGGACRAASFSAAAELQLHPAQIKFRFIPKGCAVA
jgi:hypothetical protein